MLSKISQLPRKNNVFLWFLVLGIYGIVLQTIRSGQIESLFLFMICFTTLIIAIKYPMLGLLFLLLMDSFFFRFVKIEALPYFQITSSVRINAQDALTIPLSVRSFQILLQKKEKPLFLGPLLLLFSVIMISLIFGVVLKTSDLASGGGRILRVVSKYGIYFIILLAVDTRQKMETFIKFLYVFATSSLLIQFMENIYGRYFVLSEDLDQFFEGGNPYRILVGGIRIPYIWNRMQFYVYITLFLSLSCLLVIHRVRRRHIIYVGLAFLGFALMLIRGWIIYIISGTIAVLFLSRRGGRFIKYSFLLFPILLIMLTLFSIFKKTYAGELINNFILRLGTLVNFRSESSFVGRADLWKSQFANFISSPVFGLGPGAAALSVVNTDTGMVNTMVLYGIMGLLAVFILIISIFGKAYHLWKHATVIQDRAYALGLIGVMVGVTIGYPFYVDAFTVLPLITILVMGILDRIYFLNKRQ